MSLPAGHGPVALITGVTGQDGGYLAERLLSAGYRVHGVLSPAASAAALDPQVICHRTDLLDAGAVAALVDRVRPDTVFHLAAVSSVAASWADPVATSRINTVSTTAVLDGCLRTQDRTGSPIVMVNASSCEIFAGADESPQTEATPLAPTSPYGVGKAMGHLMCQVYRGRGLAVSNAILYNHESPRRPERFVTRKITRTVAAIAAGRADHLTLGDITIERDWGWAPDYVDAMYRMAERAPADDYLVATGATHSIADFVGAAFAAAGIEDWRPLVRTDAALLRPADKAVVCGDATKARTTLGWRPTKSFEDIVTAMVDADREQEQTGHAGTEVR